MPDVRRCQITIAKVPCLDPAEVIYDAGCEHEHITVGIAICAEHVGVVVADPWLCTVCQRIDGHKCPVLIREVARA